MAFFIPHPKKCTVIDKAAHTLPFCMYTEDAAFLPHLQAFSDCMDKAYGRHPLSGKRGGLEVYRDDTLDKDAYRLDTREEIKLYASDTEGLSYGLATVLQLTDPAPWGYFTESVLIEDKPDKGYRAFMVDLGRGWHPFSKLLKYVDVCFFYKIKYFHLHFADTHLYTLPSRAFPKLTSARHYTYEQIEALRAYAKARGVVLVPEFECPGHAPLLTRAYPEVFKDKSTAEDGGFYNEQGEPISSDDLLCAGSAAAEEGVKTLLSEISEMFPDAPYLHIGGDEANIALWARCEACKRYMAENGLSDVYELYSDYVGRMARHVLSLGKTPIVFEGFPRKGADKIPKETVVIAWESLYNLPNELVEDGFSIVNASWKPLYIIPGMAFSRQVNWCARDILEDWDVYTWKNWWSRSKAYETPICLPATDKVLGAMLCAWEGNFEQEISSVMSHLAAMSEKTWSVQSTRTYEDFTMGFRRLYDRLARIIQDV